MQRTALPLWLLCSLAACGPALSEEEAAPPSRQGGAVAPPFGRPGAPPPVARGGPVLFSAPRAGELGVARDAVLQLTFPEPMDVASAEGAIELRCSCTGGALPGLLRWRDGDTVVRFRPEQPLPHGAVVTWRVSRTIQSAGGRAFSHDSEGQFRVVRVETLELRPEFSQSGFVDSEGWSSPSAFVAGDLGHGRFASAFFTFELGELSAAARQPLAAELSVWLSDLGGAPDALGALVVTPVDLGAELDAADLRGAHLLGAPVVLGEARSPGRLVADVARPVAEALQGQGRRDGRVQLRVSFERPSLGEAGSHLVWLAPTDEGAAQGPRLSVSYETP